VVIIERDKDKLSSLSDAIDCGFIHGDGTRPALLREAGFGASDMLFCLTNNDQSNILASLVGRSLGIGRIVTKIEDPEYEHICRELGLTDIIVPDWNTAQTLADMATGRSPEDFASFFKADLRLFSFVVREEDAGLLADLKPPGDCRAICIYRGDGVILPSGDSELQTGDEVVLVTGQKNIERLQDRFAPAAATD
jgi:trk system potassium uptake protein TrkA